MGDINSKYCWGKTEFVEGCVYNVHINDYMPKMQKTTLELNYDSFSLEVPKSDSLLASQGH